MVKQLQLKIFLVKRGVERFEDVIDSRVSSTRLDLDPGLGWDGTFLVKDTFPKTPGWTKTVEPFLACIIHEGVEHPAFRRVHVPAA